MIDGDVRCLIPNTYIKLGRHLYEVIGWDETGPESGMLRVRNVRTLHDLRLRIEEAEYADIIIPESHENAVPVGWS